MLWGDARVRRGVLGLTTGAVAAAFGLLPWVVTGMRLPLQNLWADPDASPASMPIALLPFNQYHVSLIAALVLVGSATAAGAVRLLARPLERTGRWSALAGVLLVQWVALLQAAVVTGGGLRHDPRVGAVLDSGMDASDLYLTGLVVGTAVAIALGVAVFVALTSASTPAALVALAVLSLALGSWCNGLVAAVTGSEATTAIFRVTRWLPAVVTGLGIAASRLRTASTVAGATVAVALVWAGTATVTAVTTALGTRVLLTRPRELGHYGVEVLRAALGPAGNGLTLAAVAAVIGLAGAVLLAMVLRRRAEPNPT